MTDRIKMLWIGDGAAATGFARVNHSIINNLPRDKYDIHHLAINYHGDPYPGTTALMYPAALGGDLYGFNRLGPLYDRIKPDLIFILNDTWISQQYVKMLPEDQKIVTYFPVDAKPLDREWCSNLVEKSQMVSYTEFGRSAILDFIPDADIRVIPHGIDTDIFYPMDMTVARSNLANVNVDDFIVLNANRNQPRKRIDLTIKGFAKFAMGKPDNVKIYLHMGVADEGWHITTLCERYDIVDRTYLTSLDLSPVNFIDDKRLNWIYNSCDVGLNTSMGEGWGLVPFEHGACRRAQIVPDSSAMTEIYGDGRGYLMPIDHYYTYPKVMTEGAVVSPNTVADALEYYYQNPQVRNADANAIYDYITKPEFSWKNIAKQWDELFDEVLSR